jgi:hypothetical protein
VSYAPTTTSACRTGVTALTNPTGLAAVHDVLHAADDHADGRGQHRHAVSVLRVRRGRVARGVCGRRGHRRQQLCAGLQRERLWRLLAMRSGTYSTGGAIASAIPCTSCASALTARSPAQPRPRCAPRALSAVTRLLGACSACSAGTCTAPWWLHPRRPPAPRAPWARTRRWRLAPRAARRAPRDTAPWRAPLPRRVHRLRRRHVQQPVHGHLGLHRVRLFDLCGYCRVVVLHRMQHLRLRGCGL